MRSLHKRYPADADIGAMFAESLMDLRPWDLWTQAGKPQPGTPEIVSTLEHVMKVSPDHPLALHLYIHAVEASPNPGKATKAADRLRMRQPGLGHMVHMPSHIDVRTGRWKDAANANLRAIRADHEYTEHSPNQGFYRLYMAHNSHMLMFAAMMRGQRQVALDAIDEAVDSVPAEWAKEFNFIADGFIAMPMEVRVRFGMWDEVLQMPEPPDYFPMARTMRHAARAISYAAKGETNPARGEFSMFMAARKRVPKGWSFGNNSADHLLQVAYHQVAGEILVAEGKMDKGIAELRKAVVVEDQLRYDEPPDWIQPSRHTLGAALMRAGKFSEAEKVYRADLAKLPGNGWSLYGLSEALREQGKAQESMMFRDKFEVMWADADTKISSSCMCMPR